MANLFLYAALAVAFYVGYLLYCYACNIVLARKMGYPQVHLPLMVQNSIFWVIGGPTSRAWLKTKLPAWMFNRVALSIYGVEFFQRMKPYDDYVNPQMDRNPKFLGKGKTYTLVTSGKLELWTWDREIAAQVAARPKDFNQFEAASIVMNVFGSNVLTTDGNEWSRHRRIVAGAVTERVSPVVFEESVRQSQALLKSIENGRGVVDDCRGVTTYQMFDLMKRITINVLYAAGMGNRQDFENLPGNDVLPGMKMSYIEAVKIVNEHAAGTTVIPTWLLLNWPNWLPGTKTLRALGQAKLEFPEHTRAALAREKALEAETGHARNNVLSALISASERNEGGEAEKGNERKGPALSDDELVGNSYIFTAAGFDTTANTLAYALVLLAKYPQWQEWMFEELDALLPKNRDFSLDYAEIFPKAYRTLAIMYEVVRLFPPIIHITKQSGLSPVQITTAEGSVTIPPKTTVYCNNVLLHTDPAVWRNLNSNPAERAAAVDNEDSEQQDEHVFRPSRWINPRDAATPFFKPPKGSFLAWSDGPRVCPGKSMATVEFVAILATLFREHKMEAARRNVPVKHSGDQTVPESDEALRRRLDALMQNSVPKLTLEMDVYEVKEGEERGLGLRWIKRR